MEDIKQYLLTAYSPVLYQAYKEFKRTRREREFTVGELFMMFLFHYGYLVDLPYCEVSLATNDFHVKGDLDNVGLTVSDLEDFFGSEVPDAFQFQHLCRDAFQLIKEAQCPKILVDRLFKMNIDQSFHAIRERIMRADPVTEVLLRQALSNHMSFVSDPDNRRNSRELDWFIVSDCEETTHYKLNLDKMDQMINKPENLTFSQHPFNDTMHALKGLLQRPPDLNVPCGDISAHVRALQARAPRMFRTTLLPNPNAPGKLIVFFRPPLMESNLKLINDCHLEPSCEPPKAKRLSFVDSVIKSCMRETHETAHAVKMHQNREAHLEVQESARSVASKTQSNSPNSNKGKKNKGKQQKGKESPGSSKDTPIAVLNGQVLGTGGNWNQSNSTITKNDPLFFPRNNAKQMMKAVVRIGHEEKYDPEVSKGIIRIFTFKRNLDLIRKSWKKELDSRCHPKMEYISLNSTT